MEHNYTREAEKCVRGKKKTPAASNIRSARGRPSNIVISRVMCVCVRVCVILLYYYWLLRHGRGYQPREIARMRVLLEHHRDVGH